MNGGRGLTSVWLALAGAVLLVGASLCAISIFRAAKSERLMHRLSEQLERVEELRHRGVAAEAVADACRERMSGQNRELPRADISRALIGEDFQVDGSSEDVQQGWQLQMLRLTSETLPADKFLALLPVVCAEPYGFRLQQADIRSLAGRRGMLEVDVLFTRMLQPQP